jgi:hypothetical protein
MFKATSDNQQRRTDNKKQRPVLDLSAFKSHDELSRKKSELSEKKTGVERELAIVNQKLSEVRDRAYRLKIYEYPEHYSALNRKRTELVDALTHLNAQIETVKRARLSMRPAAEESFGVAFQKMAKMMLADDVYARVIGATAHYLGEKEPE